MPRKPKEKEKNEEKKPDAGCESSWAEDQKEKGYYYDDAHGYETFDPAKQEGDDED